MVHGRFIAELRRVYLNKDLIDSEIVGLRCGGKNDTMRPPLRKEHCVTLAGPPVTS